jgi:hypothetical protein
MRAQINDKDSDPDQVESRSFWSDPDPLRSIGISQCDLSDSQANWNPSYSKSAGSEISCFTWMHYSKDRG